MKRNIVLLIWTIILFAGCHNQAKPVFEPDARHISVITYNINWGFVNPQNVVSVMEEYSADAVCLQETHRYWEDFLIKGLRGLYPYYAFKEMGAAGGLAILSKHELKNVKLIEPAQDGFFPALKAEVTTPIGRVQLLNVHLRPPVSDNGSVTVSAIYESPEIHFNEMKYFLSNTNAEMPLVIAGDFNENEGGQAFRNLIDNGFIDSLTIFDTYTKTWRWPIAPGIKLKDRLDHILSNKYLTCTGAKVISVEASDHVPVFAVFILNSL